MTDRVRQLAIAAAMLFAALLPCSAADTLKWDKSADRVDASIETWTVPQMLRRVAAATGWQIYLDPEISGRVPTKFTAKQQGEALRRLLGDYNYALVPETNGSAKFFVFRNTRSQATQAIEPIVSKDSTNRIGNELVVTLKPGAKIEDIAKKLGANIVGRSDDQNTYRLRFEDEKSADTARTSLENNSAVENVDNNYYVHRPESAQSLGTSSKPLALIPKASPDGAYTVIGVIDSAVDAKGGGFANFILPGYETAATSGDGTPSHGTAMAEIILRSLSVASDDKSTTVRLLPVNVFGENGETTTTYDIAKGIYTAVNGGAMYVNLSLGGDGDSSYLYKTIKSAYDQGVQFYAAAGNSPTTSPTFPAAYEFVTSVTAGNRDGSIASYANRSSTVDVIAPGSAVVNYGNLQYRFEGTSTSTAIVSGQAAAAADKKKKGR
jgi:thermitase